MTKGEQRLREMSTRALKANLPVIRQAHVHWTGLANGRFDEKPVCPMCDAVPCDGCALHAFGGVGHRDDACSKAYHAWDDARKVAYARRLKHPLKTKDCRHHADSMRCILWKIMLVIGDELRKRGE